MSTTNGQNQSKENSEHPEFRKFKEGFEMKTSVVMDKAKVWISGNLGTKIATKLFRGLALGTLLAAATGLYFSINQGEAGIPRASEQGACYPLYPELGPCPSEFVAVAPTIVDRYDRGLFDEVLPEDLKQGEASSRLSSEQIQCYPDDVVVGACYGFAATPDPSLTTGTSSSGVQFEEWPEAGFDSVTYHRFMSEQGKVGKGLSTARVYAEIDDGEAMVIYGYPASIFYALNEGKVARPSSINGITCHPVMDDC